MAQKQINLSQYYAKKTVATPGTDGTAANGATNGLMSGADKYKLDNINDYVHNNPGAYESGLYKITTDADGHVTDVAEVEGTDLPTHEHEEYLDYTSTDTANFIDSFGFLTSHQDISGKQDKSNLINTWDNNVTATTYPSSTLVKQSIDALNAQISNALTNSMNIQVITDFNLTDIETEYYTDIGTHGWIFKDYCESENIEIEKDTIYLLPNDTEDFYYEILVFEYNDEITSELIGTTQIDLSQYATLSQLGEKANSTHEHGYISNIGTLTQTGQVDVSDGDLLLFADHTDNKIKGSSFIDALNDVITDLIQEGQ